MKKNNCLKSIILRNCPSWVSKSKYSLKFHSLWPTLIASLSTVYMWGPKGLYTLCVATVSGILGSPRGSDKEGDDTESNMSVVTVVVRCTGLGEHARGS